MIDRLRTLSPLLRYSAYVVAVLLIFLVAIGVGATAAVVAGWQFERTGTADNAGGTSSPEAGQSETTAASKASEGTEIESSGGSKNDTTPEASFVHRATEENSRGDFTYIDDPSIDGDPDAVVLASPVSDESGGGASYDHNIGVWYEGRAQKWAIFNQDLAPVPPGTTFEVVVPQQSARLVHHVDLLNTVENYTYLDNRLTNGEPAAELTVTQNWNPGGGRGVYNNHPVEVVYDENLKQWAIVNGDGASMPRGAAFNVTVTPPRSN